MTRVEYQREITKQLNEIEGRDGYWFYTMTHQGVEEKFVAAVKDAVGDLSAYSGEDDKDLLSAETAMVKFAKLAAMCMIAMDTADMKKARVLRSNGKVLDFRKISKRRLKINTKRKNK